MDQHRYKNFTDVATNMLRRITGTFDVRSRLRHCDSHLSIEDIVSMTLEKIIVLNPVTVSDAYVRITAKTLYLDEVKRKQRLQYIDTQSKDSDMDDVNPTPIEETIATDIYDHIDDLLAQSHVVLDSECRDVVELTLDGHSYREIAAAMNVTVKAVENYVAKIKQRITTEL